MATLPPAASPFDPVLEIEDGTVDGETCAHVYYVAISEASYLTNDSGPTATRDKVLLATVTERRLQTFPIDVRRGKQDYLKPKYQNVSTITILSDGYGWPLPANPDDFEQLLTELPVGFSKQFQYGLGFKWEYRFLVHAIGQIPGINELVISEIDETKIAEPTYTLGVKRYERLRRAIDSISRRHQREAHDDKRLLAYSDLLRTVAPDKFPLKTKKVRPGAIFELVKIGAERSSFSRSDRQAAISLIKADKEEIAKTDASELLALQTDIEKIRLGSLIQKFENMLSKNLTEPRWQEFLKSNPFILSLAFAYPVFVVQDQAYVGGASLRGAGEKIADFLLAQRYTGNLALIEIKRPRTPLLGAIPYRRDLHCPSKEVSGAISQVLDQKYRLQTSFPQKAFESGLTGVYPYSIQCIVIVGSGPTDKDEKKSLELFRNATKDVTIITFDELLEKLRQIHRVFSATDDGGPAVAEHDVPL